MGKYDIDRMVRPEFWTVVSTDNHHNCPMGTVLAESAEHDTPGWICLGYVSFDTPLGQGTYCGFPRREVRPATKDEVFAALLENHPHGAGFRPINLEAGDIGFQLTMSSAIGNWTTDQPGSKAHGSILPVSRAQLLEAYRKSTAKFEEIMSRWNSITGQQLAMVMAWACED